MNRHHSLLILLLLFSIFFCFGCSTEVTDQMSEEITVEKSEDVIGIFEGLEGNHTAVFSLDGIETAFHFEEPSVKKILLEAIVGSSYTFSYYFDEDTGLYIIYEIRES